MNFDVKFEFLLQI